LSSQKSNNVYIQTNPTQGTQLEQRESREKKKSQSTVTRQSNQDKNRTQKHDNPKDVEMAEPMTSRSRSLSPKCKNKGPVPIFPT